MIEIESINKPLSNDDFIRVEEAIGGRLPAQYRSFLLAHNGGRPTPDAIDIEGAPFKSTDVQVFHGIDTEFETSDLLWNIETIEWCTAKKLLPIATDSGGFIFMLALSKENYGQVYYFDMVESVLYPYFVARDFNEFLGKIREPRPDELPDDDDNPQELADDAT